jgi:hypothetical protein
LVINNTITGAKVGDTALQIVDRQILIPVEAIVKGTDEIAVSKNGELSINQLDVSKLVQTDNLILNGGNAD